MFAQVLLPRLHSAHTIIREFFPHFLILIHFSLVSMSCELMCFFLETGSDTSTFSSPEDLLLIFGTLPYRSVSISRLISLISILFCPNEKYVAFWNSFFLFWLWEYRFEVLWKELWHDSTTRSPHKGDSSPNFSFFFIFSLHSHFLTSLEFYDTLLTNFSFPDYKTNLQSVPKCEAAEGESQRLVDLRCASTSASHWLGEACPRGCTPIPLVYVPMFLFKYLLYAPARVRIISILGNERIRNELQCDIRWVFPRNSSGVGVRGACQEELSRKEGQTRGWRYSPSNCLSFTYA